VSLLRRSGSALTVATALIRRSATAVYGTNPPPAHTPTAAIRSASTSGRPVGKVTAFLMSSDLALMSSDLANGFSSLRAVPSLSP
jgi:hypothetical protein